MHAVLDYQNKGFFISMGIIVALLTSYLTVTMGFMMPILSLVLGAMMVFVIIIFKSPFIGLISAVAYCFLFILIGRTVGTSFPFGYVVEASYVLLWIVVLFKTQKADWGRLGNDLCLLFSIWFLISVLELINPAGASPRGWLHEIRSSGLDSFLLIPLGFLIFRNTKHLNVFLYIIIGCSLLATINGITQIHVGLTPSEQAFVVGNPTHMIWGKLRAFSFYKDAGQFGASQAQFAVICGVLAIGPFKLWQRLLLFFCALAFFYGMLISGTRGSFFAFGTWCFSLLFFYLRT